MKLVWRITLLLLIVSPLAFILLFDAFRRVPEARPSPSPRPIAFSFCPDIFVKPPPKGLILRNRELHNLGGNVMGRSLQFSAGPRRVWVAVGFDVLDALEDLDFTEESTAEVNGRRVRISATDVLSGHRLRGGTWEDSRFESPCDEFTVVAWNVNQKEFLRLLRGVGARVL